VVDGAQDPGARHARVPHRPLTRPRQPEPVQPLSQTPLGGCAGALLSGSLSAGCRAGQAELVVGTADQQQVDLLIDRDGAGFGVDQGDRDGIARSGGDGLGEVRVVPNSDS
jgi:hypothetical protein